MSWLRVDDRFTSNSKIVQLSDKEFRVWMRVLCHCGQSQDPTVDRATMKEVVGLTKALIRRFSVLLLLDEVGAAWEVHDWQQYQPKDATGADRQARWRARQKLGGRSDHAAPDGDARSPESRPENDAGGGRDDEVGDNQVTDEAVTDAVTPPVTEPLPRARADARPSPVLPQTDSTTRPVGSSSEETATAAEMLLWSIRPSFKDNGTRTVVLSLADEVGVDGVREVLSALKAAQLDGSVRHDAKWVVEALGKRARKKAAA